VTTPKNIPELHALVRQFCHPEGSALAPLSPDDRPMRGQTLYLASSTLDLRQGKFRAHVFQDIINKHYIIALAHGDIARARTLHARLHSSCVTSETLRACDCDCVEQLETALDIIARKKRGILFYLMQEGRGVNYTAKARDRMLVQASRDRLTTFDAYARMGLNKDHRHYDNISQICHLLGIRATFVLLTNNPDKVAALRAQGIRVSRAEPLEVEPSPFNLAYLTSKATCGRHHLKRPTLTKVLRAPLPEPITPFRPRALPAANRFIYVASYYLPIKPVLDTTGVSEARARVLECGTPVPLSIASASTTAPKPKRHKSAALQNGCAAQNRNPGGEAAPAPAPHWFRTHVYYDIITGRELILLAYGKPRPGDAPLVRLHSESIFDRFPLRAAPNRDKIKRATELIIAHGSGMLLLLQDDARTTALGAPPPQDYAAPLHLLKHHLSGTKIQLILSSPGALARNPAYAAALKTHSLKVTRYHYLNEQGAVA